NDDKGFVGLAGAAALDPAVRAPFDVKAYACITKLSDLEKFIAACRAAGVVAFDTETTGLDPMKDSLVGFSLAHAPGKACYVPVAHGSDGDLMGGGRPDQIPAKDALAALKTLLEDPHVLKVGHNIKFDMAVMAQLGIRVHPFDDTMLISYVLDAGRGGHGMDALSNRHLSHATITFDEVTGTGKKRISFGAVELSRATEYAAEDADVTLRLFHVLKPRLAPERVTTVYEYLERPLAPVLMAMERAGVLVDKATLARLSARFAERMGVLESEIHKLAGTTFNLGSPKQLGEILFDRMSLPGGRRTATGAWSTDSDVLEELAAQGHDIPKKLMDWRQLQKLRGTYTDALPEYINAQTGRVHTSFAMASTNTGRLSSSDPNLQNIPIRTEEGRQIRTAFVAPKGKKLISADYSQIELRLLAHIADIAALKKAFAEGLDIHAMTASEMFGVPVKNMPPDVRRRAKAINFGIIYGISAFGLANQLSIPRGEAEAYIKTYFERFPGIRAYMERTKDAARKDGFVSTVFGRRIHFPEINSKAPAQRAFQERASINAPIQGSAADVIRRAMVQLPEALSKARLSAKMLLQVHDELIFEVEDAQVEETAAVVKRVMENAASPLVQLDVKLTVDARAGQNWDEAH
ncbi:MAG TPA: DNA polymerase I, partial [Micropepsaceae bacterium]|nr:DNA polymerase I [Micropepsaceae bacterium]